MPIALTPEMTESFANAMTSGNFVLVATASRAGHPDIAFKGSTMVWDADNIAFWERARGTTLSNLQENPNVCLLYRNPQARIIWKFFGVAELHESGQLREAVMARTIQLELDRDPERKGVAVVIRIDKVIQMGQVLMEREGV